MDGGSVVQLGWTMLTLKNGNFSSSTSWPVCIAKAMPKTQGVPHGPSRPVRAMLHSGFSVFRLGDGVVASSKRQRNH